MEAQVAVAKIGKYASGESGDSLEMIERPGGGLSFVLVDGQRSGKAAKAISNVVARKAISLLADGVRDGAAARAASDYLFTHRSGKVLATLNILSIDLVTQTLVITRNNPAPVLLISGGELRSLDGPSSPVGSRQGIRPDITQVSLKVGLAAVLFTDGLLHAGDRRGKQLDLHAQMHALMSNGQASPRVWADELLRAAVELDDGRPGDDISILVASIVERQPDGARQLWVRVPL